ncbi:MAG: type II toxin-antitoxin system VapC family toxin [Patescibacteria group bacterium]|nr:type II toxin-antitoxin system VapC family toxin [Patescibacteria group bacterium]
MKKIIVDASLCLKWVFEEENSKLARELLKKKEGNQLLFFAPNLWEYEIINALASAARRKKISSQKSQDFLKLLLNAKPETISVSELLNKCLLNCKKYDISGYDSAYVTLAKENKLVLVSSDDKLIAKVNNKKIVIPLTAFS